MPNFLRTLSDIGLRNKDKQIMIRTQQQEVSSCSSSNTEHNKEKELQIAEIENSLHNWSIPIVKKCEVYKTLGATLQSVLIKNLLLNKSS